MQYYYQDIIVTFSDTKSLHSIMDAQRANALLSMVDKKCSTIVNGSMDAMATRRTMQVYEIVGSNVSID